MTQTNDPAAGQLPAADDDLDLPPTPATAAAVLRWTQEAGWTVPYVIIPDARDDEQGHIRMVAAEVTAAGLAVALDNGQVFLLEARELTRPSGDPDHPYTLNPAGQHVTHAARAGAALCPLAAPGDPATGTWADVTCLDCQAAAPGRPLAEIDDLDLAMAERQIRGILIAASPDELTLFEITCRTDPGYRAAAETALAALARQGMAEPFGDPDAPHPAWRLTEGH